MWTEHPQGNRTSSLNSGDFDKSSYRSKLLKMPVLWKWGKNYLVLIYEFCSSKPLLEFKAPEEKHPSTAAPCRELCSNGDTSWCQTTETQTSLLPKTTHPTPTCEVLPQRQQLQIKSLPVFTPPLSQWPVLSSVFLIPVSQLCKAGVENSRSDCMQHLMHNC